MPHTCCNSRCAWACTSGYFPPWFFMCNIHKSDSQNEHTSLLPWNTNQLLQSSTLGEGIWHQNAGRKKGATSLCARRVGVAPPSCPEATPKVTGGGTGKKYRVWSWRWWPRLATLGRERWSEGRLALLALGAGGGPTLPRSSIWIRHKWNGGGQIKHKWTKNQRQIKNVHTSKQSEIYHNDDKMNRNLI